MVEVICTRSGLKFEAENRRKKVHPEISYYTQHSNYDVRYPAIAVIERGKAEGWDTIEKFEEEIQKALNPQPLARPDYDFEGAWAAKLVGSDEQYRFSRVFLTAVDTEGRFKRFDLKKEDGIYECCYKSGKGNETRYYYRCESGNLTDLQLEDVETLFPVIEPIKPVSVEGCTKIRKNLGSVGATVNHDGQIWTIVRADHKDLWEDDDGITHEGFPGRDCMYSWTETITYLRPATDEEIVVYNAEQAAKQAKVQARQRLVEIEKSITVDNGANSPKNANYPEGKKIVIQQGHYQANVSLVIEDDRLWSLTYNGRDGDDWRYNNVCSQWIGCWIPLTDSLRSEIQEICNLLEL